MGDAYEIYQLGQRLERAGNPDREHPDYYLPEDCEEVDTDSGEYLVETLKPDDLIDYIDGMRGRYEASLTRLYYLERSAHELVRQAELSLDYRPEFRRAIANVVRDAGTY